MKICTIKELCSEGFLLTFLVWRLSNQNQWRIREGGGQQARPLKLDQLYMFSFIHIFIRMLKYKAQIARESINTTL